MESEWCRTSIGELVRSGTAVIQTGPFGSQLHKSDYSSDGVAIIPTEAIGRGRILEIDLPRVSSGKASELARHKLRTGDILFARRGIQATGLSAVITSRHDGALCGTGAILLRVDRDTVDPWFLTAFLASGEIYSWLRSHAVGAVMPNLNSSIIKSLPLFLPPLTEQRSIAEISNTLEGKISLLRETNATLEAIAQAIFKSWFVDFDPVRAKAEGRDPEGVPPYVAELFPSEFEDSELGEIPKEWSITRLGSLCSLTKGCSYKGGGLSEDSGAFMFNLGCFNAKRMYARKNIKRYTGEYKPRHQVFAGDLIVANTDMTQVRDILGRPLLVPDGFSPGFVSHHVFRVALDGHFDAQHGKSFLFYSLLQPAFRERAIGFATGTTVLALPKEAVEEYQVPLPPAGLLDAFGEVITPILGLILQNEFQAESLADLRDTLLPRLMSGKLRIPELSVELV